MTAALVGPVKRVTLWVRDLERSLAVYRDALGLQVLEQKDLEGPAIAALVGLERARMRIVHLGDGHATFGWVGLYEVSETAPRSLATLPTDVGFPAYGQATVVFETAAMATLVERLQRTPGVRFVTLPTEYVKREATAAMPAGRYSEAIFIDPDGIPVSLLGYAPI